MTTVDVIDELLLVEPDSGLDRLRRHRQEARSNAQASYAALFERGSGPTGLTARERFAVATFIAGLHETGSPASVRLTDHYRALLRATDDVSGIADVIAVQARAARTEGPYGVYREPGLTAESVDGLRYRVPDAVRGGLGSRLTAALEHAHLLVFRPRESSPDALQTLVDAGLGVDEVVTLSQLVSFLTFQIRVVIGLETLA